MSVKYVHEHVLWRIGVDAPDYEAHDLTGAGAEKTGGRWNKIGTTMLYASESIALACLETVAHLAKDAMPLNRYLVKIVVPADAWKAATKLDPAKHVGWDALPVGAVSLNWGEAWAASKSSLLAAVPSVIVPEEWNVLINPAHPDIAKVKAAKERKFLYDIRLTHKA